MSATLSPPGASAAAASASGKGPVQLPAVVDPPSAANPPRTAVWIIFGATGHMGRSLVRTALNHGDKVTAVGKQGESTQDSIEGWHENCQGLLCDVRIKHTVDDVLEQSVRRWGEVNVIANCTGYGVIAAAEDQTAFDVDNQFATNFMGTLHILQAGIPYFRTNSIAGRFLVFSSTAGALGVPGMAPYCATKYAVEGLIESMLYEVHAFNIKATLVEPGYVRDDDDGDEPEASTPEEARRPLNKVKHYGHFSVKSHASPPYDNANSPSGHAKRVFQWLNTRQPTSAKRSAEIVWQLAHCSYPPLRLLLGSYAVDSIRDRLKSIIEEIEDWKHLSFPPLATDSSRGEDQALAEHEGGDDSSEQPDGDSEEEDEGEEEEGEEEEDERSNG